MKKARNYCELQIFVMKISGKCVAKMSHSLGQHHGFCSSYVGDMKEAQGSGVVGVSGD